MCVLTRAGLVEDVRVVKGIEVLPSHMDNIVEAAQVVVYRFLSKGTTHKPTYWQHKATAHGHESTYSTRVMNPLTAQGS